MFKVSEFSKIAQVPASLLRYYDKIGLFRPAYTDDLNGYRYYGAEQLGDLSRVLALKELGLSLEQVRRLVQEDVSTEEIRGMFALRKAQLERSLQEEAARLKVVETRLLQLGRAEGSERKDIVLKSIPAQHFLGFCATFPSLFDLVPIMLELTEVVPSRLGDRAGHITAVLYGDAFEMEDVDVAFGYALSCPVTHPLELPSGLVLEPGELPAIETAATSVRVGGFENGFLNYGDMGAWLEANRYTLLTPHREVMMVPPLPGRQEEAVVEIQMPLATTSELGLDLEAALTLSLVLRAS